MANYKLKYSGVQIDALLDKINDLEMSNYYNKVATDDLLAGKQDKLTFGSGLSLSESTLSIDDTVVATKTFVSDNYATKLELENVAEIAEGKSKGYVINTQSQITGTKDSDDNYTNVTAITGITLTDLHLGDIIYIKELNVPDYWVSAMVYNGDVLESISLNKMETSKVDLDNYVDLDSNQTIPGQKTFSNGVEIGNGCKVFGDSSGRICLYQGNSIQWIILPDGTLRPYDGDVNIGTSFQKVKDLYLSGSLKDGTNSVTITDLAALVTYAKTQGWIS